MRIRPLLFAVVCLAAAGLRGQDRDPDLVRVLVWNVQDGAKAFRDGPEKALAVIRAAAPDVCLLQESYDIDGDRPTLGRWLASELGWNAWQGDSPHLCVLTPLTIERELLHDPWHGLGAVLVDRHGRRFVAYSTWLDWRAYLPYALRDDPNADDATLLACETTGSSRVAEVDALVAHLREERWLDGPLPLLVGGDWNCPSHRDWTDDTARSFRFRRSLALPVSRAIEAAGLDDAFRLVHPDPTRAPGITWTPLNRGTVAAPTPADRIDRLYVRSPTDAPGLEPVTAEVVPRVLEDAALATANRVFPSDHGAVLVDLRWTRPADDAVLHYAGGSGPGAGKRIVLIAGDEEYRSEEAMPMLARVLAVHHGFDCDVLFHTDPKTGCIDPGEPTHLPHAERIADADLLVLDLRFRQWDEATMKWFTDHLAAGKPVFGIRTSTHAFRYAADDSRPIAAASFDRPTGFGSEVLGETWVAHHGNHGSQATRGIVEPAAAQHPVLRGVRDVFGPTDVYRVRTLPADAIVLMRGAVLDGMSADAAPVAGRQNEPMMPLVWVRERARNGAATQRIVCSTIGASQDLSCEDLRRLFVNACYWAVGLEAAIPAHAVVDPIGDYRPSRFGFGGHVRGVRPADLRWTAIPPAPRAR